MSHSTTTPTKAEAERIKRMLRIGCIVTRLKFRTYTPAECHHIVEGYRLGHWWTLPLSPYYHRGVLAPGFDRCDALRLYGPSLADGSKLFEQAHGTEKYLWMLVQRLLKLDRAWPTTKILPRRVA